MKLINGASTENLVDRVNAEQTAGHVPAGGVMYQDGLWFQAMIPGDPQNIPYIIAEEADDVSFQNRADFAETFGALPLGTVQMVQGRFVQAFGEQVLPPSAAPVNQVFRASFTTAAAEATQLVTAANTPQVITFNAQQIPNAELGTLDNATGVFTAARDIAGLLSLNAQIRRGLAGNTTWAVQIETSPDGVTWTPVPGSSRRILLGAGENNLVRFYDFTTSINVPAGTRVRFTQMVSDATNNTGIVALAAGLGGTTAAGFIFALYTVS